MKESSKLRVAKEAAQELKHGGRRFGHDETNGRSEEELTKMALDYLNTPDGEEEIGSWWADEGFDGAVIILSNILYYEVHPELRL